MTALAERRFRAMGSDAHVIIVGGADHVIDDAEHHIEHLERLWSRFIETSEVCELNRHAGDEVVVSGETALLVERAIDAWRLTGGGFDPTVLGAVLRAGYDVSFEAMPGNKTAPSSNLLAGCTDIEINGCSVRLPAGASGACVNLGGDLRVAGENPQGGAWTIAIEHPSSPDPIALVGLDAGAVATSTTLRRRWIVDGQQRHHLIDPATGEPSDSDLELSTVIAAEAWIAEVLAKAVLLRGSQRAFDVIDDSGVQALTIDIAGVIRITPGFQQFTGAAALPVALDGRGRHCLGHGVDDLSKSAQERRRF